MSSRHTPTASGSFKVAAPASSLLFWLWAPMLLVLSIDPLIQLVAGKPPFDASFDSWGGWLVLPLVGAALTLAYRRRELRLDPQQLIEIRELIRELGRDRTVMLSSHIMQEISAVCDMIIIIANGKLVAEDSPENLERMAEHEQTLALTVRASQDKAREIVATLGEAVELQSIHTTENGETTLEVGVLVPDDVRERLFYAFADAKCAILSMEHRKQSLEDVFLTLTAEGAPRPEAIQGGDAQ